MSEPSLSEHGNFPEFAEQLRKKRLELADDGKYSTLPAASRELLQIAFARAGGAVESLMCIPMADLKDTDYLPAVMSVRELIRAMDAAKEFSGNKNISTWKAEMEKWVKEREEAYGLLSPYESLSSGPKNITVTPSSSDENQFARLANEIKGFISRLDDSEEYNGLEEAHRGELRRAAFRLGNAVEEVLKIQPDKRITGDFSLITRNLHLLTEVIRKSNYPTLNPWGNALEHMAGGMEARYRIRPEVYGQGR